MDETNEINERAIKQFIINEMDVRLFRNFNEHFVRIEIYMGQDLVSSDYITLEDLNDE
jgi:hypothetical protein